MFKIQVLFVTFVLCVVYAQSDNGCSHSRPYTRVKRGKYYSSPPLRFYNRPPMTIPINGAFSYTPPPFMQDDEPPYPGSRPYKVSKRPTNEGLGDADINNLVKHLSKQDLDKLLEFAYEKDKYFEKSKDTDYNYKPFKRDYPQKPAFSKDNFGKGNIDMKYQDEKPYEVEFKKYVNFVTEATPMKYAPQGDRGYPNQNREAYQVNYGPNRPQEDRPSQFKFYAQEEQPTQFKAEDDRRPDNDESVPSQHFAAPQVSDNYPGPGNQFFPETAEEETPLPPPDNMRHEDFDVSYTNNVPTVIKNVSPSYEVENFGDLPLMNYNSKLHSVSSYHVPHYTVTQPKSPAPVPSVSFSSSQSFSSSSTLLKPSPAAASIKAPPFEPAPPPSAAKEQSDAHLKAVKIWSHKSKGAAYTLHEDGTLTPEWPRPKYG